jgi:hypothetical protein
MKFVFQGNLLGYLCSECIEPLFNAKVKLYRLGDTKSETALAVADTKETFHEVTREELNAKSNRLFAEAVTNDKGDFEIIIDEKSKYNGGAFEIDFECGTVPVKFPWPHPPGPVDPPRQFHITTLQPIWKEYTDEQQQRYMKAFWEYAIPARWYCRLLSLFKIYVICGRVTDCQTKVPLKGLRVFAFDVDLIQDDPLGSALTDSNGKFKIWYTEADFSKTIFSWLNVEWPAGPDIYFRIETGTGTVLLQEPRTKGRTPGRMNAPNCLCVELCVEGGKDDNYVPALFTHVGQYAIAGDFDANGFTNNAERNAFTGTIPLIGILPGGNASNAMEYRFKIKNLDTLTEVIADANLIAPTKIGTLIKFSPTFPIPPFDVFDYYVNNPAATFNVVIKPGGWIEVPRENNLATVGLFQSGGNSALANLITNKLTDVFNENYDLINPAPVYKAGDAFPAGKKAGVHTFEITFEAREVGSSVLSYSTVLQKIVISNVNYLQRRHPAWAGGDVNLPAVVMLEISETTLTGAGCNKISTTATAVYSVVHPHLDNMEIFLEGNPPLPADFSQNLSAVTEAVGTHVFDTSLMGPCAYIMWLSVHLRLTSGYGRISASHITDHIAFCKS